MMTNIMQHVSQKEGAAEAGSMLGCDVSVLSTVLAHQHCYMNRTPLLLHTQYCTGTPNTATYTIQCCYILSTVLIDRSVQSQNI